MNLRNNVGDEEKDCVVSDADAAAGVGSGCGIKRGGADRSGGFPGSQRDSDGNFIIHLDEDVNSSRQEYAVRGAVSPSSSHDGSGSDAADEEEINNMDRNNGNMEMVPILNKIEMGSVAGDSDGKEEEVGMGPNVAGADNDTTAPHSGNQTFHPGIHILRRISTLRKVNKTFLRLRRRNTSNHPHANPNNQTTIFGE